MQPIEGQYIHGKGGRIPSPLLSPVSVIAPFAFCTCCYFIADSARSEDLALERSNEYSGRIFTKAVVEQ